MNGETAKPSAAPARIHSVFPMPAARAGIAGILLEFCDAVDRDAALRRRFTCTAWLSMANREAERRYLRGPVPQLLARLLVRRAKGMEWMARWTMRQLRREVRAGDVAVLYPGPSVADVTALRARGVTIVHDPVNAAYPLGWNMLERAYAAAGMPMRATPDAAAIALERGKVAPDDAVLACSPHVADSYAALGVPRARIVPTSYGFNPHTFHPVRNAASRPTFLFCGSGSVRKGLPILLRAWAQAGIDGRLLVVGRIEPEVAEQHAALMRQTTVEFRAYTSDLVGVYGEADAFVLTSFEEGSPLVSYLALAAGLPSVMSPASAGWVVRDGIEGFVVEPDDVDAIARSLRALAEDPVLRGRMATAAARRSADYTWDRVAQQRLAALGPILPA